MTKLASFILFGPLLAACAAGPRAPTEAKAPPVTAAPPEWPEYSLELAGLRAKFPEPPREVSELTNESDVTVSIEGLTLEQGGLTYSCIHARTPGHDRVKDAVIIERYGRFLAGEHARSSPIEVGNFRGAELEGDAKTGHVLGRVVAVGDGAVYGTVAGPAAKLDRAVAARFVSGCELDLPWRVFPVVSGGFTVAAPAFAIEVDTATLKDWGEDTSGRIFVLGGTHELSYVAAATPLAPEAASTDAQTLLESTANAVTQGAHVTWSAPAESDGAPAKELIWSKDGVFYRWRMIVTHDRLFQLGLSTKSETELRTPSAERFFASLRRIGED